MLLSVTNRPGQAERNGEHPEVVDSRLIQVAEWIKKRNLLWKFAWIEGNMHGACTETASGSQSSTRCRYFQRRPPRQPQASRSWPAKIRAQINARSNLARRDHVVPDKLDSRG